LVQDCEVLRIDSGRGEGSADGIGRCLKRD